MKTIQIAAILAFSSATALAGSLEINQLKNDIADLEAKTRRLANSAADTGPSQEQIRAAVQKEIQAAQEEAARQARAEDARRLAQQRRQEAAVRAAQEQAQIEADSRAKSEYAKQHPSAEFQAQLAAQEQFEAKQRQEQQEQNSQTSQSPANVSKSTQLVPARPH